MSRKKEKAEQARLQEEMAQASRINLVTCGSCGHVMLHRIRDDDVECPFCGWQGEPCDFPDLFYYGFEEDFINKTVKK